MSGGEAGGPMEPDPRIIRRAIVDRCEETILHAIYGPCINGRGKAEIRNAIIDAVHDAAKLAPMKPWPSFAEPKFFHAGGISCGYCGFGQIRAQQITSESGVVFEEAHAPDCPRFEPRVKRYFQVDSVPVKLWIRFR